MVTTIVGGLVGGVLHETFSNFSLLGMLRGLAWSIPGAAAFGAYGFLQGLVGIRRAHLEYGGTLAITLAVIFACVGASLTGSSTAGITGGVIGALLGARLFGLHFPSRS